MENTSNYNYKIFLLDEAHGYTMASVNCDNCKTDGPSPNPFLDIFVCDDCYHKLISKVYYPNAIEVCKKEIH